MIDFAVSLFGAPGDGIAPAVLLSIGGKKGPQYLFNVPDGFSRLVLEHRVRPGSHIMAVFATQVQPLSMGGLSGLIMRLRSDGHDKLHIIGPSGVQALSHSIRHFLRWRHPRLMVTECSDFQPALLYKDVYCEVAALWGGPLSWAAPDWLPTEGIAGQPDTEAEFVALEPQQNPVYGRKQRTSTGPGSMANRPLWGYLCYVKPTNKLLLLVDVPSMAALHQLQAHPALHHLGFQGDRLAATVHLTGPKVASSPAYRQWIKSLPGQQVVMCGSPKPPKELGLISSARNLAKLSLISPRVFPLPRGARPSKHTKEATLAAAAEAHALAKATAEREADEKAATDREANEKAMADEAAASGGAANRAAALDSNASDKVAAIKTAAEQGLPQVGMGFPGANAAGDDVKPRGKVVAGRMLMKLHVSSTSTSISEAECCDQLDAGVVHDWLLAPRLDLPALISQIQLTEFEKLPDGPPPAKRPAIAEQAAAFLAGNAKNPEEIELSLGEGEDEEGDDGEGDGGGDAEGVAGSEAAGEPVPAYLQEAIARGDTTQVVFLGTGSAEPSKYRGASAIHVRFDHGWGILMDAGEGAYGQLIRRYGYKGAAQQVAALACVWVSHKHADHMAGLAAIIAARSPNSPPLLVIGPKAVQDWLGEIGPAQRLRYRFVHSRSFNQPQHPEHAPLLHLLGLASWQSVAVDHCFEAFALVLHHQDGWKLVYSGDTRPCPRLRHAGRGATLLIHEATFEPALQAQALSKRHSTTDEALQVASDMGAYRTILTHFSQRYPKIPTGLPTSGPDSLTTAIAFDGMSVPLVLLPDLPKLMPAVACALDPPPDPAAAVDNEEKQAVLEKQAADNEEKQTDAPDLVYKGNTASDWLFQSRANVKGSTPGGS
ncbi:hypothetical protein WJX72_005893 [[Myrmecia] bisecta]|uniref:ribonuclease Z n=1 Tax=[Myrmecia] bisecta TaxID=41462 RepID=A0AAW1R6J3_9CHLO